jgi:peroxiredoxin family protein
MKNEFKHNSWDDAVVYDVAIPTETISQSMQEQMKFVAEDYVAGLIQPHPANVKLIGCQLVITLEDFSC